MSTVYDLPSNFPSYQDVQVGDIFIWFVGNEALFKDGQIQVHGHWFQIVYKDTKYAQVDVKVMRCDKPENVSCGQFEPGATSTIGWSKLQHYQDKTRWLRTPGAKTLFQDRGK